MEILDGGRISVAAMGVGLAQGAYDLAFAYAKEREQFGRPIAKFQAMQFALADMATEIEAGRQLVYRAAWLKDQGKDFALAAAQAKLYTGLLSNRAANAVACRSTAGTASWRSTRSRASTATRRSSRSAKARTRCSAWSSRSSSGSRPGALVLAHAAWSAPPVVLSVAAVSAVLFAQGWLRLRRRGRRDLADWKRAALFALGLPVVLAGLVSPIHTIGENHLLSCTCSSTC